MEKNDRIILTATDVNDEGDGIGRLDGMVVFVKGMLPGETAEILIIKRKASYAIGRLLSLITPSAERIPSECTAFEHGCGGCSFCHLRYEAQLVMKRRRVADCLQRIGGFEDAEQFTKPCIPEEQPFSGRNKAAYPFTELDGKVRCGFFARNSHRVVPLSEDACCATEKTEMRLVRNAVCTLATRYDYRVYREETGKGLLRHLIVRFSEYSGKAMVVLVLTQKNLPHEAEFTEELCRLCPFVDSVYLNVNAQQTNVIFGRAFRLLYGSDVLLNTIGEAVFRISPASFYQVNSRQTEKLYRTVYDFAELQGGEKILDLYCGAGTIGLYLLKQFEKEKESAAGITLAGVEIVADAVADAKENARLNRLEQAVFVESDAPDGADYLISHGYRPDLVILDPPRKGCDEALLETLGTLLPPKLIYVSCNPATLARDLKQLAEKQYEIRCVQPVDMFPMTGHVECVVLLSKA